MKKAGKPKRTVWQTTRDVSKRVFLPKNWKWRHRTRKTLKPKSKQEKTAETINIEQVKLLNKYISKALADGKITGTQSAALAKAIKNCADLKELYAELKKKPEFKNLIAFAEKKIFDELTKTGQEIASLDSKIEKVRKNTEKRKEFYRMSAERLQKKRKANDFNFELALIRNNLEKAEEHLVIFKSLETM